MKIPLFDAHCDTVSKLLLNGGELYQNDLHINLARRESYQPYAQFFAIWWDPKDMGENTHSRAGFVDFLAQYTVFRREMNKNPQQIRFCRSVAEVEAAAAEGKIAALLSVEGGELLDCDTTRLEEAYHFGVRAVNITWNYDNALSGANAVHPAPGLSEKGKAFVIRCQELGVIVDLSHISEEGFWDVLEIAKKPVMASHSCARALCGHPRNLTDAQFQALVRNGGIAGVNLYTEFLGGGADIHRVIQHIEHFLALGGARHIGIGGDLDGCDSLPEGINGLQDIGKIYETMLKKGYAESLVRDIFYNNMLRFLKKQG